ncbi:pyridoxal phosphate-dependent aminotransferase [Leptospira gomenensis]|uniref:Pyridoxal phosphate-dependent aminotransferase n=1 Tax=Leptospira gomenensis TaxID=2484974 RepID=A0A5F1Z411_9LEPT|nr:pyridoxal phosphate-dependent aminotransferase [Leptospira gomenensis]TGK35912.1 pyridoxal phosphate-dependent aminotransferase [Leptospira gomenensis]TGK40056.1 pyridoxal phosphate-dependent aminotransferase [Leptospira gomenensis]TGK51506.1 pyridoxal phosphate-dependent aminotransferase [Leptospira gomenensis]TGK68063.1 pyridoxal phosphate-dependent aminotransferase [Leptospira gomenensis]
MKPDFSSRFSFQEGENEFAAVLSDFDRNGVKYFDLTASNPTEMGFQYPREAISHAFQSADCIAYRPDPRGVLEARKTVCDYYASKGYTIDPEDLFLVSSSSEAYSYLFKLFCDPGDSILIPAPGYPLFEFLSAMENLNPIHYRTKKENGWKLRPEDLEPQDLSRSKILLVVSPNNPTGSILTKEDFASIRNTLIKHNIPMVIDEVFSDYVYGDEKHSTILDEKTPVITVNGLSKSLGLPGMKLSWILISGPKEWKKKAAEYLELISDTYLSANAPVQNVLPELFRWRNMIQSQIVKRIGRNLAYLRSVLAGANVAGKIGSKIPQAGWYCVLESALFFPEEQFALELLKKSRIYVHPGEMFGFQEEESSGKIVLGLLADPEDFVSGIDGILNFLNIQN